MFRKLINWERNSRFKVCIKHQEKGYMLPLKVYINSNTHGIEIKDLFGIFFLYIYIYYRKYNAEFNKLIKTVGQSARFFEK